MNELPFFSIIIPLYNKEAYIQSTLDSVALQTIQNYEVVVVDDGSTDNSEKIVKSCSESDQRIRLIRQPNKGVSAARNTAIRNAKGSHYAFLDADDVWAADHLAEIQELAIRYPNAGMLGTAFQRCFPIGPAVSIILKKLENKKGIIRDYFRYITEVQFIYTSSIVIPAWAVENEPLFPEGVRNGEDLDLWTRLALKWEVAYSGKVTVAYSNNIQGQTTGELAFKCEFDPYYPAQLVEHFRNDKLQAEMKKQLRIYSERYLVRRGGYFFMAPKFSRQAFMDYMSKLKVREWTKSIILKSMCLCPMATIWRPYFLFQRIIGSRRFLAICGGTLTRNGIKRKKIHRRMG